MAAESGTELKEYGKRRDLTPEEVQHFHSVRENPKSMKSSNIEILAVRLELDNGKDILQLIYRKKYNVLSDDDAGHAFSEFLNDWLNMRAKGQKFPRVQVLATHNPCQPCVAKYLKQRDLWESTRVEFWRSQSNYMCRQQGRFNLQEVLLKEFNFHTQLCKDVKMEQLLEYFQEKPEELKRGSKEGVPETKAGTPVDCTEYSDGKIHDLTKAMDRVSLLDPARGEASYCPSEKEVDLPWNDPSKHRALKPDEEKKELEELDAAGEAKTPITKTWTGVPLESTKELDEVLKKDGSITISLAKESQIDETYWPLLESKKYRPLAPEEVKLFDSQTDKSQRSRGVEILAVRLQSAYSDDLVRLVYRKDWDTTKVTETSVDKNDHLLTEFLNDWQKIGDGTDEFPHAEMISTHVPCEDCAATYMEQHKDGLLGSSTVEFWGCLPPTSPQLCTTCRGQEGPTLRRLMQRRKFNLKVSGDPDYNDDRVAALLTEFMEAPNLPKTAAETAEIKKKTWEGSPIYSTDLLDKDLRSINGISLYGIGPGGVLDVYCKSSKMFQQLDAVQKKHGVRMCAYDQRIRMQPFMGPVTSSWKFQFSCGVQAVGLPVMVKLQSETNVPAVLTCYHWVDELLEKSKKLTLEKGVPVRSTYLQGPKTIYTINHDIKGQFSAQGPSSEDHTVLGKKVMAVLGEKVDACLVFVDPPQEVQSPRYPEWEMSDHEVVLTEDDLNKIARMTQDKRLEARVAKDGPISGQTTGQILYTHCTNLEIQVRQQRVMSGGILIKTVGNGGGEGFSQKGDSGSVVFYRRTADAKAKVLGAVVAGVPTNGLILTYVVPYWQQISELKTAFGDVIEDIQVAHGL